MKLANHNSRAVILTSETEGIDVATASEGRFGPEIQDVYDQWDDFLTWAPNASGDTVTIDPAQLGAVSPRPLQSMGVGLNYAEHVTESGFDTPDKLPPVFPKFQSSLSVRTRRSPSSPAVTTTGRPSSSSSSGAPPTTSPRAPAGTTSPVSPWVRTSLSGRSSSRARRRSSASESPTPATPRRVRGSSRPMSCRTATISRSRARSMTRSSSPVERARCSSTYPRLLRSSRRSSPSPPVTSSTRAHRLASASPANPRSSSSRDRCSSRRSRHRHNPPGVRRLSSQRGPA